MILSLALRLAYSITMRLAANWRMPFIVMRMTLRVMLSMMFSISRLVLKTTRSFSSKSMSKRTWPSGATDTSSSATGAPLTSTFTTEEGWILKSFWPAVARKSTTAIGLPRLNSFSRPMLVSALVVDCRGECTSSSSAMMRYHGT